MILLLLVGCLERVTGEAVPLDPRFYAAVEAAQGDPGQGAGSQPFAGYDGETVSVTVTIIAENPDGAIDLGVRIPDPNAPGGMNNEGRYLLDEAGEFTFTVPKGLGRFEVEALQDAAQDGPTAGDPHASAWIEVGDDDITGIEMTLAPGDFAASGPSHVEAPPGAPGGDPNNAPQSAPPGAPGGDPQGSQSTPDVQGVPQEAPPGAPGGDPSAAPPSGGGGGGMDPFVGQEGPMVTVQGTLRCEGCTVVDLDLFRPNPDAPGGREMLGKVKLPPGAYSLQVPRNFGPLLLEAFSDRESNGPGPGDPMGRYADNPLRVGGQDISGVDVILSVTDDGKMPGDQPAPPPQRPPDR